MTVTTGRGSEAEAHPGDTRLSQHTQIQVLRASRPRTSVAEGDSVLWTHVLSLSPLWHASVSPTWERGNDGPYLVWVWGALRHALLPTITPFSWGPVDA